jgi:hypothetical protein
MRARSFFYLCAGVLMLAIAYHLGASSVDAQTGTSDFVALVPPNNWQFVGNVASGGPISVEQSTMSDVKGKYRDEEDE